MWDYIQPEEARSEQVEDWLCDKQLTLLNDGRPTRFNRATGNGSTPDIAACGKSISGKTEWDVVEGIGSSDHLPTIITIWDKVNHHPVIGKPTMWKKNVDWSKFTEETEKRFMDIEAEANITNRVLRFTDILTAVAEKHVGKSKPKRHTKPWLTPIVKQKIKLRNRLRRTVKDNRVQWIEACRDVNESIRIAKEERWKALLEDVITDADETKLWGIISKWDTGNKFPESSDGPRQEDHN